MSEGTLIYSPAVSIVIESTVGGIIDVSADCTSGSLNQVENASHSLSITLENPLRKYDGMFVPNDRIHVSMKRFRWLPVFTGYLDRAPYFSTYPRKVTLSAQCSLKALRYWQWDPGTAKARDMLNRARESGGNTPDGGMGELIQRMLTEVVGWPSDRIHIGSMPTRWYDKFKAVYDKLGAETEEIQGFVGENPFLVASNFSGGSGSIITGGTTSVSASDAQLESIRFDLSDPITVEMILATIRTIESGNDYTAQNANASASGAYQMINSTWRTYGTNHGLGSPPAKNNSPANQDQAARNMLEDIYTRHASKLDYKLMAVPISWYYGSIPANIDFVPMPEAGNVLTLRQYAYKWLRKYVDIYTANRGTTPFGGSIPSGLEMPSNATIPSGRWPSPAVSQLISTASGWGGHTNGHIPSSALTYTDRTGQGHPIAVVAWNELCDAASKVGLDLRGSMYRDYAGQVLLAGGMGATPGRSNHGWGLAIDVAVLVPGSSRKYPGTTNTAMYQTAEYKWLMANSWRFGFGQPTHAQAGGSKPEAWHWEFLAWPHYPQSQGVQAQIAGGAKQLSEGVGGNPHGSELLGGSGNPFGAPGGLGGMGTPIDADLFNVVSNWIYAASDEDTTLAELFSGYRAPMNDESIMLMINKLLKASGRSYCAAPNGDFIAWFPDYWGEMGLAGVMEIQDIELKDFSVDWADQPLITHQYVRGAMAPDLTPGGAGPVPIGVLYNLQMAAESRGVATVDMPGLLAAILNVPSAAAYPWLRDPRLLLQRFGARVDTVENPYISGPHQEFYAAVSSLQRAWAAMFTASAPITFMPEMYPGMLMRIPSFGVQMYVTGVTHTWDYSSGFSTTVETMAISSTREGEGFYIFPHGGDPRKYTASSGGGRAPLKQ